MQSRTGRSERFGGRSVKSDAGMTRKEKAIAVIRSLNDDVTIDEVIDRLYLLLKIELGIAQVEKGDVQKHEMFMAELEREHGH